MFQKIFKALRPGGSFWINDVIIHEHDDINKIMHEYWKDEMIENLGVEATTANIKQYEKEDTPQSLNYQLELMQKVGFKETHVLHKHFCFAAFGSMVGLNS